MSPIFEYCCTFCGCYFERLRKPDDLNPRCPECTAYCERLVSKTGYRRDHTVVDGDGDAD